MAEGAATLYFLLPAHSPIHCNIKYSCKYDACVLKAQPKLCHKLIIVVLCQAERGTKEKPGFHVASMTDAAGWAACYVEAECRC